MSDVLYIVASPRGERSYSVALAKAFIEAFRKTHPKDEVKEINVFKERLPAFDGDILEAKYAILHGQNPTPAQKGAWKKVEERIEEFKAADKYVLAVPMWNFGIPYRLKNYIDVLVQPTYTFAYVPGEGYKGLVTGKRAFITYARGGTYGPDAGAAAFDFQKRYLECILNFIGITDIQFLVIEGTLGKSREEMAPEKERFMAQAREMAGTF